MAAEPAAMNCTYRRDFECVWVMLKERSPVAFALRLARITGHPKDAVLLSQLVYWSRRGRDVAANKGWIHKTREQWRQETALSREEQENARKRLREMNLVQEWRGGQPARLHYRVDTDTLVSALTESVPASAPVQLSFDFWSSRDQLTRELLGPTTAYHRVLASVTGSVNSALLLSRMIQLQRYALDARVLWFTVTAHEWKRDLGMNRRQLENAKEKLRQLGLIEEFST